MKRLLVLGILLAFSAIPVARAQQTQLEVDEKTLRDLSMPTDAKGLVDFFEKRSLKDGDAKNLESLARKLRSSDYRVRETAKKELIVRGPVALPFLRTTLADPESDLEAKYLARHCVSKIEETMQAEPISAAARVLAARKDPKAASALFNFLPSIGSDPFLEEEVLACVGRLTITADKVDPLLLNALKDSLPFRRTAAAYLIGRRGNAEHREQLRKMLADSDVRVPQSIADGLFGKRAAQSLAESLAADEKLIRDNKLEATEAALLAFFKKRTLNVDDQKRFRGMVRSLGSDAYVVRERATISLQKEGVPALAFLKEAEHDNNVERSRRARDLLDKIRSANSTSVPIAGAHLLTRPGTKKDATNEIIRTLLAYAPFTDDESVEEELLTCLTLLSLRDPQVEPDIVKALSDPSPAKRAAAAFVLGHVGVREHVAKLEPLLNDVQPLVRLRAAQGMLAAHDKAALPSFVNLLKTLPSSYLPRVEEVLHRLAEDKGPTDVLATNNPDKAVQAWTKWLTDNKDKIDLTSLHDREAFLGLVTVAEYDNQVGNIFGQVWESPRAAGQKRWSFNGNPQVQGAMDAHTLPNGNVLVAENNSNRVTERDTKGNIKWEFNQVGNNPICCQRLPNGNTFIASYNMFMEVKPDKSVVYRITPGPQFYIFSCHKARNGHVVAITAQGQILEMDTPKQGDTTAKTLHTTQTVTQGNWCSVELLPNNNYLVASMNPGTVREIDRKGTEVWKKDFNGVFRATRLPNGNVLACSMNTRQVVEIERATGNFRWQVTTTGRPWSVHYR